MDRIAVVKEHTSAKFAYWPRSFTGEQAGGLAHARSQFPFAFGRVIVGPPFVLQVNLGEVRLPFIQLLRGGICAAYARGRKIDTAPLKVVLRVPADRCR